MNQLDLYDEGALSLDSDVLDLGSDDLLDLDGLGGDDLLSLGDDELAFSEKLVPIAPGKTEQLATCLRVERLLKAKKLKVLPYEGVIPEQELWDLGDVFDFWLAKHRRDKNTHALEVAYYCASRLLTGLQHVKIRCALFPDQILKGEVVGADTDAARVMVTLPFDNGKVRSNILGGGLRHSRLVWFHTPTGRPLDAAEPFAMI